MDNDKEKVPSNIDLCIPDEVKVVTFKNPEYSSMTVKKQNFEKMSLK